jgi:hypothetical protein
VSEKVGDRRKPVVEDDDEIDRSDTDEAEAEAAREHDDAPADEDEGISER